MIISFVVTKDNDRAVTKNIYGPLTLKVALFPCPTSNLVQNYRIKLSPSKFHLSSKKFNETHAKNSVADGERRRDWESRSVESWLTARCTKDINNLHSLIKMLNTGLSKALLTLPTQHFHSLYASSRIFYLVPCSDLKRLVVQTIFWVSSQKYCERRVESIFNDFSSALRLRNKKNRISFFLVCLVLKKKNKNNKNFIYQSRLKLC